MALAGLIPKTGIPRELSLYSFDTLDLDTAKALQDQSFT